VPSWLEDGSEISAAEVWLLIAVRLGIVGVALLLLDTLFV